VFRSLTVAMFVGCATIGAPIDSKARRNTIGWLMVFVGIAFVVGGLAVGSTTSRFKTNPGALPFGTMGAWLLGMTHAPSKANP